MISPNQERIVAIDSVVVVTHPSNPVQELSVDQLRAIFAGQINNWSQLGGADRPINVVARQRDTASYNFFMSYLFEEGDTNYLPQAIVDDDQEMLNVVYQDRNAIGYVGFAFQRGAKPVTLVNECGIATKPDAFSAKTEEYALNRRMYLYNRSDNLDDASQSLLDFAVSQEADAIIGKSGFIDLGIVRREQSLEDPRAVAMADEAADYDAGFESEVMREMLEAMTEYDRLSTTFRFRTGSSKIDERGMLDMQRLVRFLERAPEGTEVKLVGFTDSVGPFEANRRLAMGRADEVLNDLRNAAGSNLNHVKLATAGYGEIAPSACNVSERGREINRRVEVWISKANS
jgi:phosphate transport system substrate-binding protein